MRPKERVGGKDVHKLWRVTKCSKLQKNSWNYRSFVRISYSDEL